MSDDRSRDTVSMDPTTRAEFEGAIETIIRRAYANGVTVEDGITLRTPESEMPEWGIEVTRLRKRE